MKTHQPSVQPEWLQRRLQPAVRLITKVRPAVGGAIAGATILVLVVFGTLQRTEYPHLGWANLDSEASTATWVAAILVWLAAAGWTLVATMTGRPSRALWVWSAILVWLAIDEGSAIHERIERWSGIDWQLLYLPILALAAATWWVLVRRYRANPAVTRLLVAAAAAWVIALTLELIQNWGGHAAAPAIYNPAMITEEALEMVASSTLLIAAVVVLRSARTPG